MKDIVIIQYNAGNVRSVLFALERMGVHATLTGDHDCIRQADKVIFPGVGEASSTMAYLRRHGLDEVIRSLTQPVLGVCLGMQLLCTHSEENDTECLGIIPQQVKRFVPKNQSEHKVPHMGWNAIHREPGSFLPESVEGEYVYFVHSYYAEQGPYTAATCNYIEPFSAAMQKDNFVATQFHPEKSGPVGARILEQFVKG